MNQTGHWLLGVDAGGTASRALARHAVTGEERSASGPGANWTVHGPALCSERLTALVTAALPGGETPKALCLCLAGFYPPDHAAAAHQWAHEVWPDTALRIAPDYLAAWAGALSGRPGILVIAGTGSIAYGRDEQDHEARAGGWGPLFGDEGSAYWLGRELLAQTAQEDDAGAPPSALTQWLLQHHPDLGAERREWLRGVYRQHWQREEVAALAAALSDPLAATAGVEALQQRAGELLGDLALRVSGRLALSSPEVALVGGVGERCAALREAFATRLEAVSGRLVEAAEPPVAGALRLAVELAR